MQKSGKTTIGKASKGFSDEERAAMRDRAQELKAAERRASGLLLSSSPLDLPDGWVYSLPVESLHVE